MIRKFFCLFLTLSIISLYMVNSFAFVSDSSIGKIPNMVKELDRQIKINDLKNVKVEKISKKEQQNIENFVYNKQEMRDLKKKLKKDGFKKLYYNGDKVIKIIGGNDNSILYYIMNVYVNNKNEKVVTLTIFSEDTNQILISYSEKLDRKYSNSTYHLSYSKYSFSNTKYHNYSFNSTSNFDLKAFLCGMTGTIACGAFSAMLFAFVPASIAAGMTCGAAFNYVCSVG